jgi:hypothetical protein
MIRHPLLGWVGSAVISYNLRRSTPLRELWWWTEALQTITNKHRISQLEPMRISTGRLRATGLVALTCCPLAFMHQWPHDKLLASAPSRITLWQQVAIVRTRH